MDQRSKAILSLGSEIKKLEQTAVVSLVQFLYKLCCQFPEFFSNFPTSRQVTSLTLFS